MKVPLLRFTPYDQLKGWLRGLAVSVAAAAFLTFSGAFGTGDAPLAVRAAYWLTLMVLGYGFGAVIAGFFFRSERAQGLPRWVRIMAAAAAISVPYTGVVWLGSRLFLGSRMPLGALPLLFLSVYSVAVVITLINALLETRLAVTATGPAPPKFLERLPLKLRGAEVWAVEAEDHYLRLHTSKGQDLILMRLADAVDELEGIEGARVHRSWWVARDAIVDAKRGDGRATLKLKDGSEVPVSRSYAGMLRERNWI